MPRASVILHKLTSHSYDSALRDIEAELPKSLWTTDLQDHRMILMQYAALCQVRRDTTVLLTECLNKQHNLGHVCIVIICAFSDALAC